MKKLLCILVALAGPAFAGTDYESREILSDIQLGKANKNAIQDLYVADNATVVGKLSAGSLGETPVSLSVTNFQTIPATAGTYLITPLVTPCTNYLAAPGLAGIGRTVNLIGMAVSTNMILADAAGLALESAQVTNGQYDVLSVKGVTSNLWVELFNQNN